LGKISDALEKALSPPSASKVEQIDGPASDIKNDSPPAIREVKSKHADVKTTPPKASQNEADFPEETQAQSLNAATSAPTSEPPVVPMNDQAVDSNLVTLTAPDSYEAEQFRMLRTNVLFPRSGQIARSIMIASTAPSEGKSFVTANLAISIAQNIDKYVLLIDCDMRRPSIHSLFGYGPIPGLSNYLTQGKPLTSLLRKTFIERLSILPGGPEPSNPAELLSSGRMTDLLNEVTQRYSDRFIIIDTPPLQLTAEAQALAKFADGVLLVVRFGTSSKELVAEVAEKLDKNKLIGVVGNFADRRSIYKNYAEKYSGYYGGKRKGRKSKT
jgi:exopolysaccharide/PEP-CTERM locus tyrosine autokinase